MKYFLGETLIKVRAWYGMVLTVRWNEREKQTAWIHLSDEGRIQTMDIGRE